MNWQNGEPKEDEVTGEGIGRSGVEKNFLVLLGIFTA